MRAHLLFAKHLTSNETNAFNEAKPTRQRRNRAGGWHVAPSVLRGEMGTAEMSWAGGKISGDSSTYLSECQVHTWWDIGCSQLQECCSDRTHCPTWLQWGTSRCLHITAELTLLQLAAVWQCNTKGISTQNLAEPGLRLTTKKSQGVNQHLKRSNKK